MAVGGSPHVLRVKAVDADDGEVLDVVTDLVSLPDHPMFKEEKFCGLLDALVAFFKANPAVKAIDVSVVGKEHA